MNNTLYRKAVGIMLLNHEGLIFAGRRIDNTAESWQMPQGGIDAGESPRAAALRELHEEVGTNKAEIIEETNDWLYYDLPPQLANKLWGGKYKGQMQKWFVMKFTGNDTDINIDSHIPEFSAWKWTKASDLPPLIVDFKRDLYNDLITRFKHLLT